MNAAQKKLRIGVVLGDPRLPYPYAVDNQFGSEEIQAVEELRKSLDELSEYDFTYYDDHERMIDDLRANKPDLVLNFCDTGFRNDFDLERNIPAFLEMLEIPYTGADPMGISLGTDKAIVRSLALNLDIPVPNETFVDLTADPLTVPDSYPSLIKPNGGGGSFGITENCVVHDAAEAHAYLQWLSEQNLYPPEAICQDFLTGDEYTVGMIGNPAGGFTVLPPLVIDYSKLDTNLPPILTYSSKADPDSAYWGKLTFGPAELDEVTRGQLVDACAKLFKRLGFRDYSRIDFRCGADGVPRLIDANTNPTWYWDGKMAMMASWAGYSYADMLRMIIEAAIERTGVAVKK